MSNELVKHDGLGLDGAISLGQVFCDSGFFKDAADVPKAVVKILAGRELGLGPMASMTGFHIVEGKPEISANLQAVLVKRSGRYDYKVVTKTDQICEIDFFQIRGDMLELLGRETFTIDDARRAGLAHRPQWQKFPKNMVFARCMSNGVATHCPDAIGLRAYSEGELEERDFGGAHAPETTKPKREPKTVEATVVQPLAAVIVSAANGPVSISGPGPQAAAPRKPDAAPSTAPSGVSPAAATKTSGAGPGPSAAPESRSGAATSHARTVPGNAAGDHAKPLAASAGAITSAAAGPSPVSVPLTTGAGTASPISPAAVPAPAPNPAIAFVGPAQPIAPKAASMADGMQVAPGSHPLAADEEKDDLDKPTFVDPVTEVVYTDPDLPFSDYVEHLAKAGGVLSPYFAEALTAVVASSVPQTEAEKVTYKHECEKVFELADETHGKDMVNRFWAKVVGRKRRVMVHPFMFRRFLLSLPWREEKLGESAGAIAELGERSEAGF